MIRGYFYILLFLHLFISSSVIAQTTSIPDPYFEQALIDLGIDSDGIINGSVATADIEVITTLDISNRGIELIAGIEDFTNLTELYCQNNDIFDVYVSQNEKLKILNCSSQVPYTHTIIELFLPQNSELEYLNCSNNPTGVQGLNTGLMPNLKTLICSSSGLSSLNVSSNTKLEYLNCSTNYYYDSNNQLIPFSNLTLGQNSNLTAVSCSTNEISSLDLTGVPNLVDLNCANNNLTGINLTQNTVLEELHCQNNQLTSLYLTYSTNLSTLKCNNNQLTILNVKNGSNSNLTTFDAQNNPSLTCIEVDDANAASNLMPPYDTWLKDDTATYLEDCENSTLIPDPLFELALIYMSIDSDNIVNGHVATSDIIDITSLDLPISFDIEDLTGIEDFINLKFLDCSYNKIKSLDLDQNINLESIYCNHNQISSLIIGENTNLTYLNCEANQITNLDVSGATSIGILYCSNYYLTSLNLGINTNLNILECSGSLVNLDVTNCSSLMNLWCGGNQLTSLDLSQNTNLQLLACESNQLTSLNVKNGNNSSLFVYAIDNPTLICIQVDDANAANAGEAPYDGWYIDAIVNYSEDCSALGIDDESYEQSINLYPNPVSDVLTIDAEISLMKVEIFSILGKKIQDINSGFKSILVDNLSNGVYIVKIFFDKGFTTKKFIKN